MMKKEKLKKQAGISLISLTITIIVLVVITSMLIYNAKNGIKTRALKMMENDIEMLDDKINSYYVRYGALPAEIRYVGNMNFTPQENDNEVYYVVDLKALEGVTLNYGSDFNNIRTQNDTLVYDDVYIVNEQSHHVYYAKGIQMDGAWYYTTTVDDEVKTTKTIKCIANGGTIDGKDYIYLIKKENVDLILSVIPERAEHVFIGWSTNPDGPVEYEPNSELSEDEGLTLYAQWELKRYNITYNLNGGTISGEIKEYTVETETFTLPQPTKNGYTFTGWTGSNGTTPQTTVTIPKGSTGDKSYTANWQPITYKITYNLNGGSMSGQRNDYTIETETFTLPQPTRSGYKFIGWTGSNGTTPQTTVTIPKGSTGDKSYTANWQINTYSIAYNLNGGSFGSSHPTSAQIGSTITINNPTRSGWTFDGWEITGMDNSSHTIGGSTSTATSLTGVKDTSFRNLRSSSGTVTFKARWYRIRTYSASTGGNNTAFINGAYIGNKNATVTVNWGYTFTLSSFGSGTMSMYLQGSNDGLNWQTIRVYADRVTGHKTGTDTVSGWLYYRPWKEGDGINSQNWHYEGVEVNLSWTERE